MAIWSRGLGSPGFCSETFSDPHLKQGVIVILDKSFTLHDQYCICLR